MTCPKCSMSASSSSEGVTFKSLKCWRSDCPGRKDDPPAKPKLRVVA